MTNISSKPNLPIDVAYVLQEKTNTGLTTKQLALFTMGIMLLFYLLKFYIQHNSMEKLKREIANIHVGDKVQINSIGGVVTKVDHNSIYLGESVTILKKDIINLKNYKKNDK